MVASADVTRREVTLGAQDATTGWYAKSWNETTIQMVILPRGASLLGLPIGALARYEVTGFTSDVIADGDEIIDANGDYYLVVASQAWWWLDQFSHYTCSLVKQPFHADRAATSGTWHLDSDAAKTDPRYRHKLWLDTYLAAGNLLEDDGATPASTITVFSGADYSVYQVFVTKAVDGIFNVDIRAAQAEETWDHHPYRFVETVPITCYAMDKASITGVNLLEQMEQEIRHVATDHPVGSLRSIESTEPKRVEVGGLTLWETTVTIRYRRPNDEYLPSYPTFTYGQVWTYEGDRLAGGVEGTWTLTAGGSTVTQAVNQYLNLLLDLTVFVGDAYSTNGTNLSLSTTLYPTILWRYRTTGAATAKIVATFSDASTQTVLAETASSTFTVGSATLTTGKILDHLSLYCCDGVGSVEYDYVQVYVGTYVMPNVTMLSPPSLLKSVVLEVPGMVGDMTQILGAELVEVSMECNLDVEPSALTWKRPQTTSPKTDYNTCDILLELGHQQGRVGLWSWLDLGDPSMQMKAYLVSVQPSYSGETGKLLLTWREHRVGSAAGESAVERFGLNL